MKYWYEAVTVESEIYLGPAAQVLDDYGWEVVTAISTKSNREAALYILVRQPISSADLPPLPSSEELNMYGRILSQP